MLADARSIALRWPEPRPRALAELAVLVTEAPWRLSRTVHDRARAAGLDDEHVLHAIALAAFFGHLNRIADVVAIPLDYAVRRSPPHAEPATPALEPAPQPISGPAAIPLAQRPATAAALGTWRDYVMTNERSITAQTRSLIASRVATLLGDRGQWREHDATDDATAPSVQSPLDRAFLALAEQVTLAPWRLGADSFAEARAAGANDEAIFDACVTASTAGVMSRIAVALAALAR